MQLYTLFDRAGIIFMIKQDECIDYCCFYVSVKLDICFVSNAYTAIQRTLMQRVRAKFVFLLVIFFTWYVLFIFLIVCFYSCKLIILLYRWFYLDVKGKNLTLRSLLLTEQCPGPFSRCDHTSWFLRLELQITGDYPHSKWRFSWG